MQLIPLSEVKFVTCVFGLHEVHMVIIMIIHHKYHSRIELNCCEFLLDLCYIYFGNVEVRTTKQHTQFCSDSTNSKSLIEEFETLEV